MSYRITAQLPVEGLRFWKFGGSEALSGAFIFTLQLLGEDARVDGRALLGKPVTVTVPLPGLVSAPRYFNGKITAVSVGSQALNDTRYAVYTLTVESDPRQEPAHFSGTDGAADGENGAGRLRGDGGRSAARALPRLGILRAVPGNSFEFISRLMALEGIYWYFRHAADSHTLVLADAAEQHTPFPGYESIPYHVTASGGTTSEEGLTGWFATERVTPGLYSTDDYDFRKPNAWLLHARQNPASPSPGQIDVYDWPGHFVDHDHGEAYARIRQQAWQAEHRRISAGGTASGLAPGHTFTLTKAPHPADNGDYLILSATYAFEENSYASGGGTGSHHTDITVIPAAVTFRPVYDKPWSLPAAATQMGFLSRSKDGSAESANALRFEDKAGEEQLWVQAQKDMEVNVKADASRSVGKNHTHYVGENEAHRVAGGRIQGVKANETVLTGGRKSDAAVDEYVLGSGLRCGWCVVTARLS